MLNKKYLIKHNTITNEKNKFGLNITIIDTKKQ